jgi:hypothetical protein
MDIEQNNQPEQDSNNSWDDSAPEGTDLSNTKSDQADSTDKQYTQNAICNPPTINIQYPEQKDTMTKANWINFAMVVVTLVVLFYTCRLYNTAYEANKQSKTVFDSSITRLKRQDIADAVKDEQNKFRERMSDSTNHYRDSMNGLAFQLQINAFKETQNSFKFNKEATQKELRAYISISNISLKKFIAGSNILVDAIVSNVGKTPAYKCSTIMGCVITRERNPVISKGEVNQLSISTLVSGEKMYPTLDQGEITAASYDAVKNGIAKMFIITQTTFTDIFNKTHYNNTCSVYDFKNNVFAVYDKGNNSD